MWLWNCEEPSTLYFLQGCFDYLGSFVYLHVFYEFVLFLRKNAIGILMGFFIETYHFGKHRHGRYHFQSLHTVVSPSFGRFQFPSSVLWDFQCRGLSFLGEVYPSYISWFFSFLFITCQGYIERFWILLISYSETLLNTFIFFFFVELWGFSSRKIFNS